MASVRRCHVSFPHHIKHNPVMYPLRLKKIACSHRDATATATGVDPVVRGVFPLIGFGIRNSLRRYHTQVLKTPERLVHFRVGI
ncbi:hypothetical protein Hanom_Chr01g00031891 [Helianthus anomalus]